MQLVIISLLLILAGKGFSQTSISPPDLSIKKSIAKSLILPGLGEYGLGENKRGQIFTMTELSLWTVLFLSQNIVDISETQFKSTASKHAGVTTRGKSNQYFVDIGNYETMEDYNETQQRYRSPDLVYPAGLGFQWSWDSDKSRNRFKKYRINRDLARKVGRFVIGGIVLNHIISVIDVTYLHRIKKTQKSSIITPSLYVNKDGMSLTMTIIL